MIDSSKYYVFYDGDCGFCNHWVQWILKRDKKDRFLFASLQSDLGQKFLNERGLENKDFSTLYLWKPDSFYLKKSQAVLRIAKILGGVYAFCSYLNIFPRFFSDFLYDKVAENRMSLSSSYCAVPDAEQRKKFVG